jgi:two-component system, NtrC family, response regulator AtoC
MQKEILIIDDNAKLAKSLARNFEQLGYAAHMAVDSREAFGVLGRRPVRAVLLDIVLGDEDGLAVLERITTRHPGAPVIMITGFGSIESAVASVKLGAFDYAQKPLDFNKLLKIVENAVKLGDLAEENSSLRDRIMELSGCIVSKNPELLALCEKAKRLAATDISVLIQGENGTGKELLAKLIHNSSGRASRKMTTVNSAAFPDSLLDNELFGHEKGAYTGADSRFIGIFERAEKSSLYLDEIGDMSMPTQAKILRALQNQEIRRIGGNETIKVDVRLIASTNRDLARLIEEKRFRQDLYYRLNAAILKLPPLRERRDDIPLLVEHFLDLFSRENAKQTPTVSDAAMARFLDYGWPGNVRELKNTINYAATMSLSGAIHLEDLPASLMEAKCPDFEDSMLEEAEKRLILRTLKETGNNKKKAAEVLSISRKTLYNKLKKYEIPQTP